MQCLNQFLASCKKSQEPKVKSKQAKKWAKDRKEVALVQGLMTQWASSLPGFDRTRHEISNIETEVKGNTATATADVVANHYLNEMFWQIAGSYEYGLVKEDGQWAIAESEQGSRDIINKAVQQASINPSPYIQRQQTKQAVIDFLTSLEDKDMEKFASVWAEDAVQDMPFPPDGFPKRVEGKANLMQNRTVSRVLRSDYL